MHTPSIRILSNAIARKKQGSDGAIARLRSLDDNDPERPVLEASIRDLNRELASITLTITALSNIDRSEVEHAGR